MKVLKHSVSVGHNVVTCGEILHFGEQHGKFYIWARSTHAFDRCVQVVLTGEDFDETYIERHIGSVITEGESFVVHAFTS